MPETEQQPHDPSRRQFLRRVVGTTILIGAAGIDWPSFIDSIAQKFREPSIQANPITLPPDQPVYGINNEEPYSTVSTLFESVTEYDEGTGMINASQDIHDVRLNAEKVMFSKFAASVAIGNTNIEQEWEEYALNEAERITGYPIRQLPEDMRKIDAQYGVPDIKAAQFAATQSCEYAAPIPIALLRRAGILECSYVAGLRLSSPLFEKTIENGVSGPSFGGMIVDCLNENGDTRQTVGSQWLHQFGFFVDYLTANTPHTYNDMEMARLIPGLESISHERLDYPDKDDTEIFNITSTKVDRIKEILSGKLILPGDSLFESPEQLQQELILRRLLAVFPEIPRSYFEHVTYFRSSNQDTLPRSSTQLS